MTPTPNDTSRFSIVCLSSQDWHVALPTNRQQIMSRAAARGHRVLFVETGGFLPRHLWKLLRRPRHDSLAQRLTAGQEFDSGVRVQKLLNLLPFAQRYEFVGRLNWRVGGWFVRRAARKLPRPVVAWIYDPRGVVALGSLGEAFAAYDCVDDYAEQAGSAARNRSLIAAADRAAGERARVVFATTRPLYERHAARNGHTHLVRNVGDFEHFRPAVDRSFAPPELAALPRPVLGFAGRLTPTKVDFDVLAAIAAAFPEGTLLLAGPAAGDGREHVERLQALPNVRWVGLTPYAELPRVVAAFDVALIPYVETEYTRSCFPLKLYEYLAAGKRVVATGLPELAGLEPAVQLVEPGNAVAAVRDALEDRDSSPEERQRIAAQNTWETRTSRLLELIDAELAS